MPSAPTLADRIYRFYTRLVVPRVPRGVDVMNPYADAVARRYTRAFLDRFYDDAEPRTLVFGINPGRFGAGITGITFTDPVALADACGVPNDLRRLRELSSIFIYQMIDRVGGPAAFYRRHFLTAVSPLGFTKAGLNLNYYDIPALTRAVTPFIVQSVARHIAMGGRTDRAVVLGHGKNLEFFSRLNAEHRFFDEVVGLPHPRWIMQYRRKRIDEFTSEYARVLRSD